LSVDVVQASKLFLLFGAALGVLLLALILPAFDLLVESTAHQ
jgi:hypothetical protein